MKRFLLLATIVCAAILSSCDKYDDSKVWDTLNDHENRIQRLEELCAQMNTNISSLQTIVNALQQKDFITTVAPINKDGKEVGYTITFSSGKSITIYHGNDGKDGSDGKDGEDGADGSDGHTPIIGVKQASDGVYYWTVDGEWLLDADGNKIKAQSADSENGEDGADGKDGKDGVTPQLKIEADYWYVSYDEGKTWTKLGRATGEDGSNGTNGKDGDSFFQDVTEDDKCVYFTLADGTTLAVAKYVELQLFFDVSSLKDVKVNSEVKVDYTVTGSAQKVEIEVMPSNDLRAEAVADDATKKSGHILIRTGSSFDSASKVVVLVSDGDKVVMKSISLQVVEDDDDDDDGTILGTPAKNEIFYTSTNGAIVEPNRTEAFGAAIVSNTYANGVGVIVFDREITSIGNYAFNNRKYLKSVSLPDSVTTIGSHAFYKCSSLTTITIPDSVTEIGDHAFYGCSSLANITIPDSVTEIGENAFSGCSSLTTITIPDSVTEIGGYAFSGCSSLTNITIPDSVTTIEGYTFYNCSSLINITIPESVTAIGRETFSNCSSLTSITIPDSVTVIGWSAFEDCSSLTSVTIGNSVKTIGEWAFYDCSSLTSVTIGNSVTEIGFGAFQNCSSLTTITIPDSVTTIGLQSFLGCKSLTSVTIGNSVTTIEGHAFQYCSSLTTITIPDSVTEMGYMAFYGCQSLKKAVIGSGVKNIGYSAFENCYFLNEIICKPTTPPTGVSNMFKSIGTSAKIYVPVGSGDAYKAAEGWSDYASMIEEKAM